MPFIITACVREVERRGVGEVGLYRVSGSASDVARLRKSFESNSYEAEQLLKEVTLSYLFLCILINYCIIIMSSCRHRGHFDIQQSVFYLHAKLVPYLLGHPV